MKKHFLPASIVALTLLVTACTPSDTGAEAMAADLAESLSEHSLNDAPLVNPEARSSFDSLISALREYPVHVSAGEIAYDMNDGVLPLSWAWEIGGNTWEYETEVDLTYEEDQWLVAWQPSSLAPDLQAGQRLGIDTREPERAQILAGDGSPIITERPIRRYGLDKTKVSGDDLEDAAADIATASGVDAQAFTSRVLAAGPKAFVEAISVRPEDVDSWIASDFEDLPGALVVSDHALLGPTRTFARELLGRAGEATAEIIEESGGQISAGDTVGISGLQKQYDEQLRGVDAVEIFTVNASACAEALECDPEERTVMASLEEGAPRDLELTLNIDLQIAAEAALARLETREEGEAPGSALVALQPSSGNILALANGEGNNGLNHAAVGHYPPGSTFKVVTALALLRSGLALDDTVSCPETITVDGREFKNYDAYPKSKTGEITFLEAIAQSCNTALIDLRERISGEDLIGAARSLGFGAQEDLGFPAFLGDLPSPSEGTPFAAALIGQGEVVASPLAMATIAASIAAGRTVTPHLIGSDDAASPEDGQSTPLTQSESADLQELMAEVAASGTASFLADLPGEEVLAKTGTAEHGENEDPPHAWIIGAQGDLAVAVLVESGVGGAETAGPVLKDFLEAAAGL